MHSSSSSTGCKLHSLSTNLTADAVEWCPINGYGNLLLCASYQLCKPEVPIEQQDGDYGETNVSDASSETVNVVSSSEMDKALSARRVGRLLLLNLSQVSADSLCQYRTKFDQLDSADVAGVLDIKWCHGNNGLPLFAAADSNGDLSLWSLTADHEVKSSIQLLEVLSTDDNDALALSLDWSTAVSQSEPKIVVSNSDGVLTIVEITNAGLVPTSQWKAHDFEAWITAFDYHNTNVVYSGGDDCKLKIWDVRASTDSAVCTKTVHSMGVCSIQSNALNDYQFASGSYDEHIMIWDSRQLRQPVDDTAVGGGVWRLKWDPFNGSHLLAACMHNGSHIVDYTGLKDGRSPGVVTSYMEHQSLVYGVDWCRCLPRDLPLINEAPDCESTDNDVTNLDLLNKRKLISSCSFYDCQVHIWTATIE